MAHAPQIKVPATYMRGGTSKGVFFRLQDLPAAAQVPGAARDALLMRVIGSPDPYGKQTDGMGAATSSTSKTVILAKVHALIMTWIICLARSRSTSLLSTGAATAATYPRRSVPLVSAMVSLILPASRKMASRPCGSGKPISAKPLFRMCR